MNKTPEQTWFDKQVSRYVFVQANYQQPGKVLKDILQQAANHLASLAIVQTRAKTVDSVAGKIQRKRDETLARTSHRGARARHRGEKCGLDR